MIEDKILNIFCNIFCNVFCTKYIYHIQEYRIDASMTLHGKAGRIYSNIKYSDILLILL